MNKTSKLFLGFASLAMLSACSSDEPKGEVTPPAEGNGAKMYLAVNISDANAMGRALPDGLEEGDYTAGQGKESEVKSADFYFFDQNGIYITQASVWDSLNGGPVADKDPNNVEYIGKNVLVLENVTEQNPPMYLVTVLNAGNVLDGTNEVSISSKMLPGTSRITDLAKFVFTSHVNGDQNFIMTTSSFANSANAYYHATAIPANSLVKTPVDLENTTPVNVYVERIAAKYTLAKGNTEFPIQLTLAGADNNEGTGDGADNIGDTHLFVKVTGFGITTTEKTSYFSKNLDGFVNADFTAATVADGWNWNSPENHRSFWGKSVNYGESNADLYNHSTVYAANKNGLEGAAYSLENTNKVASITRADSNPAEVDASKVTNFVFTATVFGKDGNGNVIDLDLVKFNGVFYKSASFMRYIMENLDKAKALNYWVLTDQTLESTKNPDGSITTNSTSAFKQIDVDVLDYKEMGNGGKMTLVFKNNSVQYYKKEGDKYTPIDNKDQNADVKTAIDNAILAIYNKDNKGEYKYPVRYNGGSTYYTVPVQHLLGTDKTVTITKEGEYGVVRNHWYEITLNKITKIGQGVFNPGTGEGEDSDIIYPDPDPDPDTYGLAAKINILSWKVVKQSVDL